MTGSEEHSSLPVFWPELLAGGQIVIGFAVAVASYRRSRCLTGYAIYTSLAIALISGIFWQIWIILSILDRRQTAKDWADHRRRRRNASALAEA